MIRLMPRIRHIHMAAHAPPASLQIGYAKLPLRNIVFITQLPAQHGSFLHRGPHPGVKPLLPSIGVPWNPE